MRRQSWGSTAHATRRALSVGTALVASLTAGTAQAGAALPGPPGSSPARVPRVVGLTLSLAARRIAAVGLTLDGAGPGQFRYAVTSPVARSVGAIRLARVAGAERVTAQSPVPGTPLPRGNTVRASTRPGVSSSSLQDGPALFAITHVVAAHDDRTVTVAVAAPFGGCSAVDHAVVTDQPGWVALKLAFDAPPTVRRTGRCAHGRLPLRTATVRLRLPRRLAGRPLLDAAPVLPTPGLLGIHPGRWAQRGPPQAVFGYLGPGGRTAVIHITTGACETLAGATASVTRGVATVTLLYGRFPTIAPYAVCPSYARLGETYVRLPSPARVLVDGAPLSAPF